MTSLKQVWTGENQEQVSQIQGLFDLNNTYTGATVTYANSQNVIIRFQKV
jgi:hypothetical protein